MHKLLSSFSENLVERRHMRVTVMVDVPHHTRMKLCYGKDRKVRAELYPATLGMFLPADFVKTNKYSSL